MLIVLLVAEGLTVVAHGPEFVCDVVDHFAQPADVSVEPLFPRQVTDDVPLDVAGVTRPAGTWAAERGNKMEIGILLSHSLEFLAIKDIVLRAHPEDQPHFGTVRSAV